MEEIIVGYQGTELSNNHIAARHFAEQNGWPESCLRPLITAEAVLDSLRKGEIRYGVMARRTRHGEIASHRDLFALCLNTVDRWETNIHHCLFSKGMPLEGIRVVTAHAEAYRECLLTMKSCFMLNRSFDFVPADNSGVAARALAEGRIPDNTAVICPREMGEHYGLTLLAENCEDFDDNHTEFALVELRRDP